MGTLSPKLGIYMIWDAYDKTLNGKSYPVAKVQFKEAHWANFGDRDYIIRLGALYNASSIGPKQIKGQKLNFHYLHIKEMNKTIDPNDNSKFKYQVIWNITKHEEYNDLKERWDEIQADFIVEIDPELQSILCDEYLAEIATASNGDTIIEPDKIEDPDKYNHSDDDQAF